MSIQPPDVVTTQRTAKRFKAIMLAGIAGLALSPGFALAGYLWVEDSAMAMRMVHVSLAAAAVSLAVYMVGHGLAWWYHG